MTKATKDTLSKVHKPFDFVESKSGSFGYIQEVNINECQDGFNDQISYSVNWIKNVANERNAWWNHEDLIVIGNMFKEIAKCAVHPFGDNERFIDKIM
jgi:hypothetical protein